MKNQVTKQFVITVIATFLLLAIMLVFVFSSFYNSSKRDIRELGVSNMKSEAAQIDNYLSRGESVLWFAAGSVEHLMAHGDGNEEVLHFITDASARMQEQFDTNFTGIYGVIGGEYLDGVGWVPPEDYVPEERDWYKAAIEAHGEMALSSPYVDAQTGGIIISFSQMLSDGESVMALDVVLNEVQRITEEMTMGGMGYGFIVDQNGLVISHEDKSEIGKTYSTDPAYAELLNRISQNDGKEFELTLNGEECTVFSETIARDWKVVIVVDNSRLFGSLRVQMLSSILVSFSIFLLIVVLCSFSVRRVIKAEKREQESLQQVSRLNMSIIRALASTIDAKDRYTSGHSRRVAEYSVKIAEKLGKSEEEKKIIYNAGLLHDVGKIRVPEEVINKPGRLTDEEFDQIRIHPVSGFHILRDIHEDERIRDAAKYHHERYDGKGYPDGLSGNDIPEIARIIAVADAYDAMASNRSYRKALPQDVVWDEIMKGKGSQFDPDIADRMLQIMVGDPGYALRQGDEGIRNILVAGSEQTVNEMKSILTDMEHICIYDAYNGEETFALLYRVEFELIIIESGLPDTDGLALCRQIRTKYNMPIILVTDEKSNDILRRVRELDLDDFLTRPLNHAVTYETVRSLLQRSSAEV